MHLRNSVACFSAACVIALQVCDSNGSMFEAFSFAAPLTAGIMYSGRGQAGQYFGSGGLKWGNFAVGVEGKSLCLL